MGNVVAHDEKESAELSATDQAAIAEAAKRRLRATWEYALGVSLLGVMVYAVLLFATVQAVVQSGYPESWDLLELLLRKAGLGLEPAEGTTLVATLLTAIIAASIAYSTASPPDENRGWEGALAWRTWLDALGVTAIMLSLVAVVITLSQILVNPGQPAFAILSLIMTSLCVVLGAALRGRTDSRLTLGLQSNRKESIEARMHRLKKVDPHVFKPRRWMHSGLILLACHGVASIAVVSYLVVVCPSGDCRPPGVAIELVVVLTGVLLSFVAASPTYLLIVLSWLLSAWGYRKSSCWTRWVAVIVSLAAAIAFVCSQYGELGVHGVAVACLWWLFAIFPLSWPRLQLALPLILPVALVLRSDHGSSEAALKSAKEAIRASSRGARSSDPLARDDLAERGDAEKVEGADSAP